MADVVYFDSGINLPFCPPTVNGIYISGSGCCSEFYSAFIGGNQTYNLTYTLPTASGTSGQVLTNDGNGNLSWTTVSGGGGGTGTLTGTGTTNYLSKWSSSTGLTNSIVLETGSTIDISGALRVTASSGTATTVMGRDANGYVSNLSLGNGLSISGGTLSFTGSTGVSGNFVPYLGATGNTDLGGYGIAGSYFQLSTSTGGTLVPGMFSWNGNEGTADLMLKGGSVTLQIGQEQVARVINETGANLLESEYKVVRINGSTGTRLKVALALASGDATSVETLGVVTENITLNQEGFVTTSGLVRGINTTGSLQGETWSDGDMLFLSPYVAGGLTNIKPQAPNHLVVMGYVVTAANNGTIYVKVDNGYELDELHNVLISSAATNEILAYDGVTGVWRNRTASSLNLVSGSGTATQVAFWGGVTTLSGSSNLYWDNTNGSLGVRTSTPSARLHVVGSGTTTGTTFLVQNSGGTNLFNITDNGEGFIRGNATIRVGNIANTALAIGADGDGAGNYILRGYDLSAVERFFINANGEMRLIGDADNGTAGDNSLFRINATFNPTSGNRQQYGFWFIQTINQTGGASGTTRGLYVNPTLTSAFDWRSIEWSNNTGYGLYGAGTANNYLAGNTSIGTITPSARLHVVGSGNTSASTAFLVQNSSSNNMLSVLNNGNITIFGTGSTNLIWDSAGRLGIGSVLASHLLHVAGSSRLRDITIGQLSSTSIANTNTLSLTFNGSTGVGIRVGTVLNATALLHIVGTGTTTGTTFLAQNSGGANMFTVLDDGNVTFGTGVTWDATNQRLGVGTTSPTERLDVGSGNIVTTGRIGFSNSSRSITFNDANSGIAYQAFGGHRFSVWNQSSYINVLTINGNVTSPSVGINTATPSTSSIFQIDSTTQGFLPPRMSTTQKTGIASPAQGLVVYDTTMQALSAYNGSNWATVGGGEQMFTITGSTATINFNAGNIADITLATSTTLTLTGGTFGTFIIKLTQDATGGRVVSWPSNVRWSGGIPPSLTTTGGKVDVISLIFDGTNYYGTYALNF